MTSDQAMTMIRQCEDNIGRGVQLSSKSPNMRSFSTVHDRSCCYLLRTDIASAGQYVQSVFLY